MKFLMIAIVALALSGCASKYVMKNCEPLNPQSEELKEFSACERQWKVWNF